MKLGPLILGTAFGVSYAASIVEFILLQKFNRWYFGLGPALLRFSARADGPWRAQEFMSSVNDLGYLLARDAGPNTILVRRSARRCGSRPYWPFSYESASSWSSRITVALRGNEETGILSLQLRYTFCWPLFAITAGAALVVLTLSSLFTPYAPGAVLFLLAAAAIALYLCVAAVNARNDARHVWDLAKQHLTSP